MSTAALSDRAVPTAVSAGRPRVSVDPRAFLAAPALLYISLMFVLPLGLLLAKSLWGPDGFTLAGYRRVFADPYYVQVIFDSLKLAFITTFIALLAGYPAAFALARTRGRTQVILFALVFLPLTVSIIVKTFGLMMMFRREGIVNWFLVTMGFVDRPIRLVFTEFSLIVGMVNVFLPFMILPIYSVVRMLDPRLTDAAASLGAGPLRTFFKVTLPLTMPGIVAGASIVFSIAVAAYVTPSLLIGDRYMTMSQVMAKAFLNLRDFQLGATMASIMLVIALAIVFASSYLVRGGSRSS
jgi:putative spermidine/putrescine transport system permease protein